MEPEGMTVRVIAYSLKHIVSYPAFNFDPWFEPVSKRHSHPESGQPYIVYTPRGILYRCPTQG